MSGFGRSRFTQRGRGSLRRIPPADPLDPSGPARPAGNDHLALVGVVGMHSHVCEQAVVKHLTALPGVREVEVDFNSKLASVLFDGNSLGGSIADDRVGVIAQRIRDAILAAGYDVGNIDVLEPPAAAK